MSQQVRSKKQELHFVCGRKITQAEHGILYATRASDKAQSAQELAKRASRNLQQTTRAINNLIGMQILEPIESWDGRTIFGYQANGFAQAVYCEIHQVPPIQ
jgi:hypothetical protein